MAHIVVGRAGFTPADRFMTPTGLKVPLTLVVCLPTDGEEGGIRTREGEVPPLLRLHFDHLYTSPVELLFVRQPLSPQSEVNTLYTSVTDGPGPFSQPNLPIRT